MSVLKVAKALREGEAANLLNATMKFVQMRECLLNRKWQTFLAASLTTLLGGVFVILGYRAFTQLLAAWHAKRQRKRWLQWFRQAGYHHQQDQQLLNRLTQVEASGYSGASEAEPRSQTPRLAGLLARRATVESMSSVSLASTHGDPSTADTGVDDVTIIEAQVPLHEEIAVHILKAFRQFFYKVGPTRPIECGLRQAGRLIGALWTSVKANRSNGLTSFWQLARAVRTTSNHIVVHC
ncbi:unnamed protein product [Protopolystoma xenopodis]|uniref:Uncharacterized protein n=1 Tax=Protopolystoma xenopodis TaxID=117903 RepID=A0A448WSW3_9PLAT|nr:unnamed protein product [Protopolystoma xenopodis]